MTQPPIHPLHEKIRQHIETTPGLSQKGLAEHMGLNPAAVNRMLYGRRHIKVHEVPVIEAYLNQALSAAAPVRAASATQTPVYAFSDGTLDQTRIIDWVDTPPALQGVEAGFAVYMPDASMAPRYFAGELMYLHPGRPMTPERDCLLEMTDGTCVTGRCTRLTDENVSLARYNPPREDTYPRRHIRAVFIVIGRA